MIAPSTRELTLDALNGLNELLAGLRVDLERQTELVVRAVGTQALNSVLFSGTVRLAGGIWSREFAVPYASVAIDCRGSGASAVTVANFAIDATAPLEGAGVHVIGAGQAASINVLGSALYLWGPLDATIGLQVFTKSIAPTFA